jgi:glycosyltransferase involved in cell wall biosynthesis
MIWHFVATMNMEPWDWRTPDRTGIGNSETSQIEMAARLACNGHDVTSYGWLPADHSDDPRGVRYRPLATCDFRQPGIWVLYRCPELIDQFAPKRDDQRIWLMFQDTHYETMTEARGAKVDRALALCEAQRRFLANRNPVLAEKLVVTSNGVRLDMIEQVDQESNATRNPHRLHFSSSPDRGLNVLLEKIFPRAKQSVPDLELHVYYGWNNIDILMTREEGRRFFGPTKAETERLLDQPGVFWHGRIGQRALTQAWLQAGLWVFPSMFAETSCATAMEAQALGAIPICQSIWALGENVRYGSVISGDSYRDPVTIERFTEELVRWSDPELQARTRPAMMQWARQHFDWNRYVPQWEAWACAPASPTIDRPPSE